MSDSEKKAIRREPDGRNQAGAAAGANGEPEYGVMRVPVDVRSVSLTIIAALALVLGLQYAEPVLVPVVLGVLISYALTPVVGLLARLRIPRAAGAAIAVLLLVVRHRHRRVHAER